MACKMVFFPRKISRKGYPARPSWTILVSVWHVCAVVRFLAERVKNGDRKVLLSLVCGYGGLIDGG